MQESMNILIVDDEEVLQDVLSTLVRRQGWNPFVARTGEEALRIRVKDGGCSGMRYELLFDVPAEADQHFQEHGLTVVVDPESLKRSEHGDAIEITHMNLNDHTVEGIRHRQYPLFSVQYHPEASPGPHDAAYLFDRFVDRLLSR